MKLTTLCFLGPLTPTGFNITGNDYTVQDSTATFEWDPPQGRGPEVVVDYYMISITPGPLSHNIVDSLIWNVSLHYNTAYIVNITAINCAGESETSVLTGIEYGKLQWCARPNIDKGH